MENKWLVSDFGRGRVFFFAVARPFREWAVSRPLSKSVWLHWENEAGAQETKVLLGQSIVAVLFESVAHEMARNGTVSVRSGGSNKNVPANEGGSGKKALSH